MIAKSSIHHHLVLVSVLPVVIRVSHQADEFQMLVGSEFSKHFIDPKLIHGVESRILEYTEIYPPMGIKSAGHNTLFQHRVFYWF